jgi:hypothetical protein
VSLSKSKNLFSLHLLLYELLRLNRGNSPSREVVFKGGLPGNVGTATDFVGDSGGRAKLSANLLCSLRAQIEKLRYKHESREATS